MKCSMQAYLKSTLLAISACQNLYIFNEAVGLEFVDQFFINTLLGDWSFWTSAVYF